MLKYSLIIIIFSLVLDLEVVQIVIILKDQGPNHIPIVLTIQQRDLDLGLLLIEHHAERDPEVHHIVIINQIAKNHVFVVDLGQMIGGINQNLLYQILSHLVGKF